MTVKHKCSGKILGLQSNRVYRCSRNATVERDSKWYCWQHDPLHIEAEAKKRRASWEAEMDRENAKYARIARNARLGALMTVELAELLEYLAEGIDCLAPIEYGVSAPAKTDIARTLAARIRKALEVNDGG